MMIGKIFIMYFRGIAVVLLDMGVVELLAGFGSESTASKRWMVDGGIVVLVGGESKFGSTEDEDVDGDAVDDG
jgi:hypothetical protein